MGITKQVDQKFCIQTHSKGILSRSHLPKKKKKSLDVFIVLTLNHLEWFLVMFLIEEP